MAALGRLRWVAFAGCTLVVALSLVLPIGVIVVWLVRAITSGTEVAVAFTPAVRSMQASFFGALATLVCAWPIAVLSARHPGPFARLVEGTSYTGYAMPGVVLAFALIAPATGTPVYQTLSLLVFAYVAHFLPQAGGTVRTAIAQVHPGLEEAARSLGASAIGVLRRVTLPLVRPGVFTAFALVFLTVMKELPITLLLGPNEFATLATVVWNHAANAAFGKAALPALLLVALSSAPMAVLVAREQRHASR